MPWDTWTLTETGAPLGYLLTTREETLQIGSQAVHQTVKEPFENTRAPVPVLPLTGGTPSDIYHYSGGRPVDRRSRAGPPQTLPEEQALVIPQPERNHTRNRR